MTGDEMLLYFLEQGNSCYDLGSFFGQTQSDIRAVAEQDSRFVIMPRTRIEWTGARVLIRTSNLNYAASHARSFTCPRETLASALQWIPQYGRHDWPRTFLPACPWASCWSCRAWPTP